MRLVRASPRIAHALELQLNAVQLVRGVDTSAPAALRDRIDRAIREGADRRPSMP